MNAQHPTSNAQRPSGERLCVECGKPLPAGTHHRRIGHPACMLERYRRQIRDAYHRQHAGDRAYSPASLTKLAERSALRAERAPGLHCRRCGWKLPALGIHCEICTQAIAQGLPGTGKGAGSTVHIGMTARAVQEW